MPTTNAPTDCITALTRTGARVAITLDAGRVLAQHPAGGPTTLLLTVSPAATHGELARYLWAAGYKQVTPRGAYIRRTR